MRGRPPIQFLRAQHGVERREVVVRKLNLRGFSGGPVPNCLALFVATDSSDGRTQPLGIQLPVVVRFRSYVRSATVISHTSSSSHANEFK